MLARAWRFKSSPGHQLPLIHATPSADRRSKCDSRRGLFQLRARGACVIRLALSWAPSFLSYKTFPSDPTSGSDQRRGLFPPLSIAERRSLRRNARVANAWLTLPRTIFTSVHRSPGKYAKSVLLPVGECGQLFYERLAPIRIGVGETLIPVAVHQYGFSCAAPPRVKSW